MVRARSLYLRGSRFESWRIHNMKKFTLLYITNPDRKTARKIALHLLKKRLIGCANIFPIESVYRWKGKIANEKEWAIIAKTAEKNFFESKKEIEQIHPYSVPCVIKIPASVNKKYFGWLAGEIK